MTVLYGRGKIKHINKIGFTTLFLFIASIITSVYMSSCILEYVKIGLRICYGSVIGAVFPFIILTDIIYSFADFGSINALKRLFERIFKINGHACGAFIIGILCGFPLGVKVAVKLYMDGCISKDECERLISFSNNTGPAFVVSGVGIAMRGSFSDGIILYFSMVISAVIIGVVLGIGKKTTKNEVYTARKDFSLSESVKSAGLSTLNISSFVIFFSVVCGILNFAMRGCNLLSFLLPFIEISNASKMLSSLKTMSKTATLLLTSFAISFSGISVHLQAKTYIYGTDLCMKRYYISKLFQGFISALITLFLIFLK